MQRFTLGKLAIVCAVALMLILPSHSHAFRAPDDPSATEPMRSGEKIKEVVPSVNLKPVLSRDLNLPVTGDVVQAAKDLVNLNLAATRAGGEGPSLSTRGQITESALAATGSVFA